MFLRVCGKSHVCSWNITSSAHPCMKTDTFAPRSQLIVWHACQPSGKHTRYTININIIIKTQIVGKWALTLQCTLPQKKRNFSQVAFLLGKSVGQWSFGQMSFAALDRWTISHPNGPGSGLCLWISIGRTCYLEMSFFDFVVPHQIPS